jgi:drug/metabolite transporter (DMT)-like permease
VRQGRLRAIAVMIAAVAAFSLMDGLLKFLAGHYPPLQVAALRGATSLPFMLLPLLIARRLGDLVPRRWPMHLLRGALYAVTLVGFIYSVRVLSLANAYAMFLSAPLIVAGLSAPLLKERVTWGNWLAILLGLAGVLVMLRPSASGLASLGALAAFIGACSYALSAIAVRVLTRTDTTASVIFWTVSLTTVLATLSAIPGWVPIEAAHWKVLLGLGVLGALGQYLLTEAFRSAPPSVVAPFEYTALLWGIGIDRVVWHVSPSARVCLGSGIVIASGLYLIWRERRQSAAAAPQSWKWAPEKGRMTRRSSTLEETIARKQEEESP